MKICIIGCNGFVGSCLCDTVVDYIGIDYTPGKTSRKYIDLDITDETSVAKIPFAPEDIVVHLAAKQYSNHPPKKNRNRFFADTNVGGLANILAHMENRGCKRMIYFSSDMVYGKPQYTPVDIDHPRQPIAEYGISKMNAELVCQQYRSKGFSVTIFRPRLIVGPGRLGILEKLFSILKRGYPVPLIGNGKNYYQMISVFDCVSAINQAIAHDCPSKTYNLGSKNLIPVYDVLTNLIADIGSKSKIIRTKASFMRFVLHTLGLVNLEVMYPEQYKLADQMFYVDISRTENELDWHPRFDDLEMLKLAYTYYRSLPHK